MTNTAKKLDSQIVALSDVEKSLLARMRARAKKIISTMPPLYIAP